MFDLSGKVAAVTGGGSGIGRAIAQALAGAGADIAILDLNEQGAVETIDLLKETGRRTMMTLGDTSSGTDVEIFASQVEDALGPLDIWINNAGRLLVRSFLDMTDDEWHSLLATNLHGYYLGCRAAARRMVPRGNGRIINVTSVTRQQPASNLTAYVTAKAAAMGLTMSLALDLGRNGITVNAIAPGATHTNLNAGAYTPAVIQAYNSRTAVGRVAQASDIAGAAVFLASDEASYVTGHELLVDGGLLINGDVGLPPTAT